MMRWVKPWIASVAALLTITAFAAVAHALVLQPLAVDMRSSGTQASTTFRVVNDGQSVMPVEVSYKRMTLGETGGPVLSNARGDEFVIFPPQATIRPGATQVFRVQWVGNPAVAKSESYMFSFSQVPVERPDNVTGIQVLYSLQSVVSVAPVQGIPALTFKSARPVPLEKGGHGVEVVIENQSPVHGYFSRVRLQLRREVTPGRIAWQKTFDTGELSAAIGLGLVPGGQTRKFVLPVDQPLQGPLTGMLLRAETRR